MLLLVVNAELDETLEAFPGLAIEKVLNECINVVAVFEDIVDGNLADHHGAATGLANMLSDAFVIGVEVIPELAISLPDGPGVASEHDGVEEPAGVSEIPCWRTHFGNGLAVKLCVTFQALDHLETVSPHLAIYSAQLSQT